MPDTSFTIGIDLGGTKILAGLVDPSGRVIRSIKIETNVIEGPDAIITQIVDCVDSLRSQSQAHINAAGIAIAGQIDPDKGEVIFGPNLNWRNVPLKKALSQALKMPIVVVNDVAAATWGEHLYGAAKGVDDFACLFVGTGVGGGLVSKGKLWRGSSSTAGEFGHMVVQMGGPLCTCGNRGCLEAFAGGWAIAQRAKDLAAGSPKKAAHLLQLVAGQADAITAKEIINAYFAHDPLSIEVIDIAVSALIAGSVSIVNAFNPRRLIFGGGIIEGMPSMLDKIDAGVRKQALKAATEKLEIRKASLDEAGVVGAAALAVQGE